MKANEMPDKVYIHKSPFWGLMANYEDITKNGVEYIKTDTFIEKACEFLKSYRQDTHDGLGYIAGIVNDKTIEDFRKYMKGE